MSVQYCAMCVRNFICMCIAYKLARAMGGKRAEAALFATFDQRMTYLQMAHAEALGLDLYISVWIKSKHSGFSDTQISQGGFTAQV